MNKCDLKISGGVIIDGTAQKRFQSDIAIRDGKIIKIGDLANWICDQEIDATKRIVAPGFIDAHTHDDRLLLSDPDMSPKASQGVTTVVVGNCGISLAPLIPEGEPIPPMNLLGGNNEFCFSSFSEYMAALQKTPPAINAVVLVGHMSLRACVMDDLERAATKDEIDKMSVLLDEGLKAGCIGMSTGLAYPPSKQAPTEEIIALASRLKNVSALYTTHMRDEGFGIMDSIHETLQIAEEAGVSVVISHHKCSGKPNWGRSQETLALISKAQTRANSSDNNSYPKVDFDVYPYAASSTVLLESFVDRAEKTVISWSKPCPEQAGRDIENIMQDWGLSLKETVKKLLPAGAIYFQMDEADLRRIMCHPTAMIGSDGLPHDKRPHPRLWGTFPRVLGHYSRDEKLFSLETAVNKMTGITANVFGLKDRGVVAVGKIADIVIFNADTVIDRASYNDPMQPASGIDYVIVAGQIILKDGVSTGLRPGQIIKRENLHLQNKT
jgi:N-acyl-D-amino-acid deacylase